MKSFAINLILLFSLFQFATSQTTWYKYPGNPVFYPGKNGEPDHQIHSSKKVLFDGEKYHLWYIGLEKDIFGHGSVCYATSEDGIHWEKYEKNPLKFTCNGDVWDTAIRTIDIILFDTMYYMWYGGIPSDDLLSGYIGFARSVDGINWIKHREPVLKSGDSYEWDALRLNRPNVLFAEGEFHMWYTGSVNHIPSKRRIGYATSPDGIHWTKHPNNPALDVGNPGSWDDHWVRNHTVLYNGSTFQMWYSGFNSVLHHIGYATSIDGINWIRYELNPILRTEKLGSWEDRFILGSQVIIQDSVYKMWYSGTHNTDKAENQKYGYATSSITEAETWDTHGISGPAIKIRVQVLNRIEYIKIDSLIRILPTISGIELINAYNKLALAFSLNDEDKSYSFAERAFELANTENYPMGKAMALYSMGNCQYVLENYSEALFNQLSALRLFDSLGMLSEVANLQSQIASIHNYSGSFDLTDKYLKQSLNIFEKLKDTSSILLTLDYIGNVKLKIGDTVAAMSAYRKRLSLAQICKDHWSIAYAYNSLGESYKGLSLDSSLYYLNRAQETWDTLFWVREGYSYMMMAEAYQSFGRKYYLKAEEYYLKCYKIYIFEERESKIRLTYGMAELYYNMGDYNKAEEHLSVTLGMCQNYLVKLNHQMYGSLNQKMENEINLKSYMEKVYQLYYKLSLAQDNKVMALEYYRLATHWKDSVYNQQNQRQWAMLQGQYEMESMQKENTMLEKENEVQSLTIKQSRIYLFSLAGFIIILAVLTFLFIRQRKIRLEHKNLVREQNLLHDLELKNVESEKLKELDHLKSRFFANISHEFRTPLTLIMGPLEKVLLNTTEDQNKKDLGTAQKYTRKLQKLINNLLTISKLESGKMQLRASETDIVKLVNNYVQAFESLAKQKNIALNFIADKRIIKAWVDKEKFEQVLNNLLSNAFKFTGEGGAIEVAVGSRQLAVGNGQWVEIIVSDTGHGISLEHIDRIFDRFYQVGQESNSYYEGTGIGLALTKELVELHHGTIKVDSIEGKGSTFTLLFPLGSEHLKSEEILNGEQENMATAIPTIIPESEEESITRIESNRETNENQPILLIVEDNTDMRAYIREYFDTEYHIIEAIDGVDGYEKSTKHIPDIIISDVMMPRMDGNEFCRKVKTDERTSHIPVILLTARASSEYKIEGLETGADDYISKPFDPKEIQVRVKNLIEQRKKLREKFVADFWKGDQSSTIQIPASDLNQTDKNFLQKALETVEQHLSDPEFDINLFSQEMAMSRQQMHRKFRAVVDQSATEFIRVIRLKKAAELLSKKSGTVSEIAYDVGFNTPYYFTKTFKEQFGIAPSEYAEKYSKRHK